MRPRSASNRQHHPRIVIIGAGFSGAAAAAALLRAMRGPFSLVLVDDAGSRGGGLAYGEARSGELLNVRARDLGLLASERGDFADWLAMRLSGRRELPARVEVDQIFAPRLLFRDYVRERLDAEIAARPDAAVEFRRAEATSIDAAREGCKVALGDGGVIDGDAVILATGFGGARRRRRFGDDPFAPISEDDAVGARNVIIVGAGLSMVDALLRLRRLGCPSPVTIISRHGLLPLSQLPRSPFPELWEGEETRSALALLAMVRRACSRAEDCGLPWQAVINGIRPEVSRMWRNLPEAEQRRFLRHARPFWDLHRHRLPTEVHLRVMRELSHPRTKLRAGRVISVTPGAPSSVLVRWRGADRASEINADLVFDCSGHRPALDTPVIASLLAQKLARIDAHGLGLSVEPDGRLVAPRAGGHGRLYALGPLGQGSLMEITAAPEIAEQADAMAEGLAASFGKQRQRAAAGERRAAL